MAVPANRITQSSNPEEWQSLYNQWLEERQPGWIVRRAGNESYLVVQTSGSSPEIAFDPVTNKSYYDDTGI
jgi:hypothetical protein